MTLPAPLDLPAAMTRADLTRLLVDHQRLRAQVRMDKRRAVRFSHLAERIRTLLEERLDYDDPRDAEVLGMVQLLLLTERPCRELGIPAEPLATYDPDGPVPRPDEPARPVSWIPGLYAHPSGLPHAPWRWAFYDLRADGQWQKRWTTASSQEEAEARALRWILGVPRAHASRQGEGLAQRFPDDPPAPTTTGASSVVTP